MSTVAQTINFYNESIKIEYFLTKLPAYAHNFVVKYDIGTKLQTCIKNYKIAIEIISWCLQLKWIECFL